eukprot:scaffold1375_cov137-Cylindrotheca_fusiformis.AAC.6
MTGVGALFELWSEWQDSKKPKDEEKEDVKLEPDPDEIEEGYFDENSDWHNAIQNRDWDSLLYMLQQFDFEKYRPKKEKKKRQLRVVKAAHWVKEKVKKPETEEPPPLSPLLALNELGQTPLHASIANLAPDRLIIRLAFSERRAALIADKQGHLPLHLATIHERNTQVIDRCIRSNFHHMQQLDLMGRTALWYAAERAVIRTEENLLDLDLYWGIPRDQQDMEWQERQEVFYEKVKFILLSYSSRRKVMIPEERLILLELLEHAAPPSVVELCTKACQGMLHTDPSLASSALKIFMRRSYPIKNLQLLLYHFPVKKEESLHAARRILTDHYHLGCRTLEGRDFSFREEMEKHALDPKFKRTLHTQEWWNKIKCLLRLCGHENDKDHKKAFEDKHLLHAALSNFDTPPSLVQLLMAMNPESIKMRHPFLNCLLVHLICRNWKYNLYPHSRYVGVHLDMEEPPMEQVLKIIITSDPSNVRKRHNNRLPLHFAIATGKSIIFLEALIEKDRKTLCVRDPETKLFPYQLAALPNLNRNSALWAAAKYGEDEWRALRSTKRAAAVEEVLHEQDLDHLSTIYTLIREYPSAVQPPTIVQKPAGIGRKRGIGMISTHFLKLLYKRLPRDGDLVVDESAEIDPDKDEWTFLKYNMTFFLLALENGEIPHEIQQWWEKMKFWIRFCYTAPIKLPEEDDYLLHSALYNPDTPPLLVELLLAIYPESACLRIEGELEYPLHIAAATPTYIPQYFENYEAKNVYQLLIDAYPKAGSYRTSAGLAVDIARQAGKDERDIAPLLKASLTPAHSSRKLQRDRSSRTAGKSSLEREKSRSSMKKERSSRSMGRSSHEKERSSRSMGRSSHEKERPPRSMSRSSHEKERSSRSMSSSSHEKERPSHSMGGSSHEKERSSRRIGRSSHDKERSSRSMGRSSHEKERSSRSMGRSSREKEESSRSMGRSSHEKERSSHSMGRSSHKRERSSRSEDFASRKADGPPTAIVTKVAVEESAPTETTNKLPDSIPDTVISTVVKGKKVEGPEENDTPINVNLHPISEGVEGGDSAAFSIDGVADKSLKPDGNKPQELEESKAALAGFGEDTPDDDEILRIMEEVRLSAGLSTAPAGMERTDDESGDDGLDDEEIRKMIKEVNVMAEKENP